MPVILKYQYLDLRWDWTCVSLSRMVCSQHGNALQHFALMLQRRGHPFWHESQGNWPAMPRERDTCNTITRLLIQSGETFVSTNSEIRNIFREYWCTAAPTPTRAGCKSVKNSAKYSKRLIASDGLRRYAFRRAKHPSCYDCVFTVTWNLPYRLCDFVSHRNSYW